jgi:hypothetical protein
MRAMAMPETRGRRIEKKPARMMRIAMVRDQPKAWGLRGDSGMEPGVENELMADLFSGV